MTLRCPTEYLASRPPLRVCAHYPDTTSWSRADPLTRTSAPAARESVTRSAIPGPLVEGRPHDTACHAVPIETIVSGYPWLCARRWRRATSARSLSRETIPPPSRRL